jgi:hypothetical protein
MRLVKARWIGLLLFAIGAATTMTAAYESDGRWKLGDDGSCYFDAADSGPDQCNPQLGRWKLGGDGSCYFDASDSGPDQCTPADASTTVATAEDTVTHSERLVSAMSQAVVDRSAIEPSHRLLIT